MGSDPVVPGDGGGPHSPSYACSVRRDALDAETRALISDTQERVLRRLAMDLHDGPMQSYLAAMLQLGVLIADLPPHLIAQGEQLHCTLAAAVDETYQLLDELRPRADSGGVSRLRACVDSFTDRHGIAVHVQVAGDSECASDSMHFALLRLVQEALTNCAKHANAREVRVAVSFTPVATTLVVSDDGSGLGPDDRVGRGRGIDGMRERVGLLGGTLHVTSPSGGGYVVTAVIPAW